MNLDINVSTDSYLQGKVSFWVPPFTELGSSNFRSLDKATGIALTPWGARETVWDGDVDWS